MAQCINPLAPKPAGLTLIPRPQMAEGDKCLQVLLSSPYAYHMCWLSLSSPPPSLNK